jgi:2-dehydro-3-deoxyphosphogluconate aldolase / (4S)-4-hydroxy-2-oxoglutarate aldolase
LTTDDAMSAGTRNAGPAPIARGVVAVIRTSSAATALALGRGLAATDVTGIEVTLTVPDAVKVIATLVSAGIGRVGAGTVRTVDDVTACADAGATFLVSPHLEPRLVEAAVRLDIPVVPGALTPSEIAQAMSLGAAAVKVFPVSAVGGCSYIRALLEPLPDARLVVSGEVSLPEVPDYLRVGAWAACVGPSLWRPEQVESEDIGAIEAFARHALAQAGAVSGTAVT